MARGPCSSDRGSLLKHWRSHSSNAATIGRGEIAYWGADTIISARPGRVKYRGPLPSLDSASDHACAAGTPLLSMTSISVTCGASRLAKSIVASVARVAAANENPLTSKEPGAATFVCSAGPLLGDSSGFDPSWDASRVVRNSRT